ncbi:MAG: response regulator [Hyphomonadaceae bacterium]|nr:response regulator [Hyphomonadaceae bacterium]
MTEHPLIHLVDDDEAIRHSASFMLRAAGYRVQTYADGLAFLDSVDGAEPGCILLDVQMPKLDGLGVLAELNTRGIDMPVIVLTGHGDVSVAVQAMKAGAADFVEKPYEKAVLLEALNTAFGRVEERSTREQLEKDAHRRLATLTDREQDVLKGLVEGLTNKAIAERFSISPRTVEIHRAHVMQKLEVDSLSAALRLAFASGLGFD